MDIGSPRDGKSKLVALTSSWEFAAVKNFSMTRSAQDLSVISQRSRKFHKYSG